MLRILAVPNKRLATATKKVVKIDKKILNLIKEMKETLITQVDPQGVGLAANQVGSDKSLFIIKPTPDSKTEAFINPRIVKTVKREVTKAKTMKKSTLEGCLSIPRIWAPIDRPKKVFLEYQNLSGKKIKKWFSGFKAIIVQHEVDHLHGIVFTKRALEQDAQMFEEKEGKLVKISY